MRRANGSLLLWKGYRFSGQDRGGELRAPGANLPATCIEWWFCWRHGMLHDAVVLCGSLSRKSGLSVFMRANMAVVPVSTGASSTVAGLSYPHCSVAAPFVTLVCKQQVC
jgi:hypothetical protein